MRTDRPLFKPPVNLGNSELCLSGGFKNIHSFPPLIALRLEATGLLGIEKNNHSIENAMIQLEAKLSYTNKLNKSVKHPIEKDTQMSLRKILQIVREHPPEGTSIDKLDKYSYTHPLAASYLATVVLSVSPKITIDSIGVESITWALARADTLPLPNSARAGIKVPKTNDFSNIASFLHYSDLEAKIMNVAMKLNSYWIKPDSPFRAQTLATNYALIKGHHDNTQNTREIQSLISNSKYAIEIPGSPTRPNAKAGTFSDKRISKFQVYSTSPGAGYDHGRSFNANLLFTRQYKNNGNRYKATYPCFCDTPMAVVLAYKEKPQAIVSFLAADPKTIVIAQLQGTRGFEENLTEKVNNPGLVQISRPIKTRGLIGLDWQSLLIDFVESYASRLGFERLGILGAKSNPWLGSNRSGTPFTQEIAARRYDDVAKKTGFTLCDNSNTYYRAIS